MANGFLKEEIVMFNDLIEMLDNNLIFAKALQQVNEKPQMMERADDTIYYPLQYLLNSYDGTDMTSNFKDVTQLSVPVTLGTEKSVPFKLSAKNRRDATQLKNLMKGAIQRLSNDIDSAVYLQARYNSGTTYVSASAMTGFQDVANIGALLLNKGYGYGDRKLLLSSTDYRSAAADLASRSTVNGIVQTAYEKALIARVAGFDVMEQSGQKFLPAATASFVTVNGAGQYLIPAAESVAATGQKSPKNNNFMTLNVNVGAGAFQAGDRFTIAGVNALNQVDYADTGELQTFTVTQVNVGSVVITPAIIVDDATNPSTKQYQNCSAVPADGAAITLLNIANAPYNPFFVDGAIKLVVGRYEFENDGWVTMEVESQFGIPVRFSKQADIDDINTKYRFDILFQPSVICPEACGIALFNQV